MTVVALPSGYEGQASKSDRTFFRKCSTRFKCAWDVRQKPMKLSVDSLNGHAQSSDSFIRQESTTMSDFLFVARLIEGVRDIA